MKKYSSPKHERLQQLRIVLLQNPQGIHRAELSRILGVNKSTITRYIREISRYTTLSEVENGKLKIDPHTFDHPVFLNPAEIRYLISHFEAQQSSVDHQAQGPGIGSTILSKLHIVSRELET